MHKAVSIFLLVAVISESVHAQGGNAKCAANGEYCLTHNDCCSRSCLSFSYKCVPVPPSASIGTTLVPVTIDTENRFGGSGDDGGASLTQKTCALNGEYCLTHAECCSGSCLTFSYKCVPLSQPGSTAIIPQEPKPQSSTVDFSDRVGQDTSSPSSISAITNPPAPSVTTQKKCAGIGEYCLTPNDCCSGSCLSFSYKCVTNHQLKAPTPTTSNTASPAGNTFENRFGGTSDTNSGKCAAVGEYCLTASECCSKSCLSFAYKCVNRYDLATATENKAQPASSIGTETRFGDSSASGAATINRQCTSNGLYCFHNKECCSGACFKSICSTEIRIGVPEAELTRPSVANGPYVPVSDLDDLITRFGGQPEQAAGGSRQLPTHTCKVVGDNCGRHEDCCTKNCHSYKRKCVN